MARYAARVERREDSTRRRGGIGRRAWFRSMCPQGRGGSTPLGGTGELPFRGLASFPHREGASMASLAKLEGEHMTTTEAGEALELSPVTIVSHIRNGRLTAVKVGRDWWVPIVEVRRFKKERRGRGRPKKSA